MDCIEIDGSYLEGGGQILRTALGLSAATGQACRIYNIRKGRPTPGLAAQHLSAVTAVSRLCDAALGGAKMGSTELVFRPRALQPPQGVSVDVGTAGSVVLVLQAAVLALARADRMVELEVSGGTHVKWSPTTDYLEQVCCYSLGQIGLGVRLLDVQAGFYPRGGGRIRVLVTPGPLTPLELTSRSGLQRVTARSIASTDLQRTRVAERQVEGLATLVQVDHAVPGYVQSLSTGSAIQATAEYENCRLGASSLGERGKRAEKVGVACGRDLKWLMSGGACLDDHMADQVLPYLALAGGESKVRVAGITDHCRTNVWVIEQFLPARFELDEERGLITCRA